MWRWATLFLDAEISYDTIIFYLVTPDSDLWRQLHVLLNTAPKNEEMIIRIWISRNGISKADSEGLGTTQLMDSSSGRFPPFRLSSNYCCYQQFVCSSSVQISGWWDGAGPPRSSALYSVTVTVGHKITWHTSHNLAWHSQHWPLTCSFGGYQSQPWVDIIFLYWTDKGMGRGKVNR